MKHSNSYLLCVCRLHTYLSFGGWLNCRVSIRARGGNEFQVFSLSRRNWRIPCSHVETLVAIKRKVLVWVPGHAEVQASLDNHALWPNRSPLHQHIGEMEGGAEINIDRHLCMKRKEYISETRKMQKHNRQKFLCHAIGQTCKNVRQCNGVMFEAGVECLLSLCAYQPARPISIGWVSFSTISHPSQQLF